MRSTYFTEPHEDARDNQHRVTISSSYRSQQCENRGAEDAVSKEFARTEQFSQPTTGHLRHDVTPKETAQYDALSIFIPRKFAVLFR